MDNIIDKIRTSPFFSDSLNIPSQLLRHTQMNPKKMHERYIGKKSVMHKFMIVIHYIINHHIHYAQYGLNVMPFPFTSLPSKSMQDFVSNHAHTHTLLRIHLQRSTYQDFVRLYRCRMDLAIMKDSNQGKRIIIAQSKNSKLTV